LRFAQVPFRRFSTAGCPFVKWVDVGMPLIPDRILDSVVYLFPDVESARKGDKECGGTGFIVGAPLSNHPNATHIYVISNYHVVKGKGESPFVRVNKKDGGVDVLEIDALDWEHIPNGGDVVVAEVCLDQSIHKFSWIPEELFCIPGEDEDSASIGLGDDVFMAGRFVTHDGGLTNVPAVRFGNISMQPTSIPGPNSDPSVSYYCLDMHSRTGFSGSPVFAFRTIGADLEKAISNPFVHNTNPILKLIGIHCSQFQEEIAAKDAAPGEPLFLGNSGMTKALPAQRILDVLNLPKFAENRALVEAQWKGALFPCLE
jgi:Trypsin-like peptidase domain